ncbi:MAG: SDR family NAD(P)-dependent oxidoreductase [Alphaproteobacteria bacterium]|nr:SDR family NAD(P)-dependent oxidoreductase [Alphaproteobacteria bacterium]MBL6938469.1 SDR family NAD(P)-dependent oxidoreductase [Alphaproteobacteria bacterium]MBL7096528.1 SDR family NAD(P)-dependent oxidoreductase [Alphaproteobacteria bacterium]
MKDFAGKIAVITGGGTGMGRELAIQLAAEGCTVAMCDVIAPNMAETKKRAEAVAPQGTKVVTHVADVSVEDQVFGWAESVRRELDTDKIHLLFNNAGIGGGGSIVNQDRAQWEKTFNVCWGGVYHGVRAFLPLMMKASEAHIVNTSSVNGFWASIGPGRPHTAYCAAKFAVKGFTEALMTDLAVNAPHIKASVVMPGHIGTEIANNSRIILSGSGIDVPAVRKALKAQGIDLSQMSDDQVRAMVKAQGDAFRDNAPTTAEQAAKIILDGVKADRWRILVGKDAEFLDKQVRAAPEKAYTPEFYKALTEGTDWRI